MKVDWRSSSKKIVDMQKIEKFKDSDFICSELAISNKKGVYLSVYQLPSQENLELFFEELTCTLGRASKLEKLRLENWKSLRTLAAFSIFKFNLNRNLSR